MQARKRVEAAQMNSDAMWYDEERANEERQCRRQLRVVNIVEESEDKKRGRTCGRHVRGKLHFMKLVENETLFVHEKGGGSR
jgi:hypothetical protein